MRILFIHQNFPGQFRHIAARLRDQGGHQVMALTDNANKNGIMVPTMRYAFDPGTVGAPHVLARTYAAQVARGAMVAGGIQQLQKQGFDPEIVVGHSGWGETLFVPEVCPSAKLLAYCEYYYASSGAEVGFDPEFPDADTPAKRIAVRARNAGLLAALENADAAITPTNWQRSRFPRSLRSKLQVMHEGIDTDVAVPHPGARFAIGPDGAGLSAEDDVVTFINRNLEPVRGYHVFMRALPRIFASRPNAHVVIVGGDGVSYGAAAPAGRAWKDVFLSEVQDRIPMERVHFVGRIPYPRLLALLQISSAHVYLTYPFVLSWSLLDAMSIGAPIVASATAPVREVVEDGIHARLVDFFDSRALSDNVIELLADREGQQPMREAARRLVMERYDLRRICLPQWQCMIEALAPASRPAGRPAAVTVHRSITNALLSSSSMRFGPKAEFSAARPVVARVTAPQSGATAL